MKQPRPTYFLEGRSWTGTKTVLLRFKTRLELTGLMLRRVLKGLGGKSIRRG
jgi:hypothetical protein